jgi:REP element-mobilizing transposase RayT
MARRKSQSVAFFLHGLRGSEHVSAVEKSLLSHDVQIRQGANLPHWTLDGATYAVVFRLADSLPQPVLAAWREERGLLLAEETARGTLPAAREERLRALFAEKMERLLDAGHGACWLRRPEIAGLVADGLRHFDGERHQLAAWCVMPNHVHAVVRPLAPHTLPDVIQSWKGYSARAANRLLGRSGVFWQAEPYDHLIRDAADFAHAVRYVWENPMKAGLREWPWVWVSEEARSVAGLE